MASAKKPQETEAPAEAKKPPPAVSELQHHEAAKPAPLEAKAEPPKAAPPEPPKPAAPAKPTHATYKVWECGSLQRDGKTYQPGDELTLPCDVGDAIVCLTRV